MLEAINLSETYLHNYKLRQNAKEQYQLTQKNIEKIRRIALKKIIYPEFKEAYEYVDELFPSVDVKKVMIYKVSAKDLVRMGYSGVEGFYDCISKTVVLSGAHSSTSNINRKYRIEAKVSRDEVIVHELCHYCYVAEGNRSVSSEMREEFAYGWSIGYLRRNGHTDDYIINYNFLPYLMNISYEEATKNILARNRITNREYSSYSRFKKKEFNKRYGKKVFLRSKEIAIERGQKLINLYSKKLEKGTGYTKEKADEEVSRFDFLDL